MDCRFHCLGSSPRELQLPRQPELLSQIADVCRESWCTGIGSPLPFPLEQARGRLDDQFFVSADLLIELVGLYEALMIEAGGIADQQEHLPATGRLHCPRYGWKPGVPRLVSEG